VANGELEDGATEKKVAHVAYYTKEKNEELKDDVE